MHVTICIVVQSEAVQEEEEYCLTGACHPLQSALGFAYNKWLSVCKFSTANCYAWWISTRQQQQTAQSSQQVFVVNTPPSK